jgi:hypothetical protein
LGHHSYGAGFFENNGLVYTSSGGHIDIAHLRIAADNTRLLYNNVRTHLLNNDAEFTFKLNVEPSKYYVKMEYPAYWAGLPEKYREKIAHKLSLELSQYFTYTMTTWHEVLTWFGFKCLWIFPETSSAFSWEDIYSNLLGTKLGARALEDKEHSFDDAMTILLKKELVMLGIQPIATAKLAAKKMKSGWLDDGLQLDRKKNTDIGLYDGFVTPTLVPGVCGYARPKSYPVPGLEELHKYGFAMNLEIEPKEFEKGKILKIIYPNGGGKRVRLPEHLAVVMHYIEADAEKKGYAIVPSEKPPLMVSVK